MKKKLVVGLLSALMVTSSVSTYAAPASAIQIQIDNKTIETDVAPELKNNTTYVPISFIAKELGATVKWESPKVIIEKGDITLEIEIGKSEVIENGKAYPTQNAAYLLKGRTMVPLRVISKHLGYYVGFDNVNKIVIIKNLDHLIDSRLPEEQKAYLREQIKKSSAPLPSSIIDNGKFYTPSLETLIEYFLTNPYKELGQVEDEETCLSFDKKWKVREEIEPIKRFTANNEFYIEPVVTLYIQNTETKEEKKICTEDRMGWGWTTDNQLVMMFKDKEYEKNHENAPIRRVYASYDPKTERITSISIDECNELLKDQLAKINDKK